MKYKTSAQILNSKDQAIKIKTNDFFTNEEIEQQTFDAFNSFTFPKAMESCERQNCYNIKQIKFDLLSDDNTKTLIESTYKYILRTCKDDELKKFFESKKNIINHYLYDNYEKLLDLNFKTVKHKFEEIEQDKKAKLELNQNIVLLKLKLKTLDVSINKLDNKLHSKSKKDALKKFKLLYYDVQKEINEVEQKQDSLIIGEPAYYSKQLTEKTTKLDQASDELLKDIEKAEKEDIKYNKYKTIFNIIINILLFTILLPFGLLLLGCDWATKKK